MTLDVDRACQRELLSLRLRPRSTPYITANPFHARTRCALGEPAIDGAFGVAAAGVVGGGASAAPCCGGAEAEAEAEAKAEGADEAAGSCRRQAGAAAPG